MILQKGIVPSLIDDRVITAHIRSPITSVRCAQPLNISSSGKTVEFPRIDGCWTFAKTLGIAIDSLNATAVDHLRFRWVNLPDRFGAVSIGAVSESPWHTDSQSRVVIGCSAQTRWVPTTAFTDKYSFWSGWYPWNIEFGASTPSWTPVGEGQSLSPTNGRIALGKGWLKLLTPPTPAPGPGAMGWSPSTIESILESAGLAYSTRDWDGTTLTEDPPTPDLSVRGRTTLLEAIICSVLVDGLSRFGSHRVFNTTGPISQWPLAMYAPLPNLNEQILANQTAFETPAVPSTDLTTLHTSMEITGFAFRRSLAGFLAMAVLLTHIAIATAHTIWVLWNKRTSHSWSTVSELIALSQNSQPASDALSNTGAGIHNSTTFANVAKIRVRTQPGSPDLDRVELVFTDDAASKDSQRRASSQEVSDSEPERRTRASRTWPGDPARMDVHTDVELGSRLSSLQRLIPRVHSVDEEQRRIVCVNHAYG